MKKHFKLLLVVVAITILISLFVSCKKEPVVSLPETKTEPSTELVTEPSEIKIAVPHERIEIGEALDIEVVFPDSAKHPEVPLVWNNSNPDAIQLVNGHIQALGVGKSTITVSTGNTVSNEIVISSEVFVKGVEIATPYIEIPLGGSIPVGAKALPENATDTSLLWQSSNSSISDIKGNNAVGKSIGECTFSITDSRGIKHGECKVKVLPIISTSIAVDDQKPTLAVGQKTILNASLSPENTTNKNINWSSSNESIASVDSNGVVHAKSIGSAEIKASAEDGGASISCTLKVDGAETAQVLYAQTKVALRTSPSTKGKLINYVQPGESVSYVKDAGGWSLVNSQRGEVGYIQSNYLGKDAPPKPAFVNNVPYLNQFSLGLPTGCEAVSGTMLLKYYGYHPSVEQVVAAVPKGANKHNENGVWFGANPYKEFVGDPHGYRSDGNWGVYAEPLVNAMNTFCQGRAKNVSGCSEDALFEYIKNGTPVVVWCTSNAKGLIPGVTWNFPDSSGSFTELVNQHCAVLIGVDAQYIYLNDPSVGQNVKQEKSSFLRDWHTLDSQAIIIS